MPTCYPSDDNVKAALVMLLRTKGFNQPGNWVDVALLSQGGLPSYLITPANGAVPVLSAALSSVTGRMLTHDQAWVLFQGDVNLLFGAVRQELAETRTMGAS
jgi:hypothetical protein